ncbi:MAG: glycosyl transferase family 2, partial [Solirubrobacterales bacterium]|nr:glycosyl transferase family 2 [Solirubrobacterales bacterium]
MSVVVPARDAAATLPALLDGLAAQDLGAAFEVLVVDDASRDATAAVARAHPVVTAVL